MSADAAAPILKMRLGRFADPAQRVNVAHESRALQQTARRSKATLGAFCKTRRNDWKPPRSPR